MKFNKQFCLKIILVLSLTLIAGFLGNSVQANSGGAEFSVVRDQPANQVDATKPYFDLNLKPNQITNFKITISNDSNASNDFEVYANNAVTNQNLIIDYSPNKDQASQLVDKTYDFQKLVSPQKTKVTIKPHSSKQVEFKVKMPAEKFDGELLGGIYVRKTLKSHAENGYTNRFNFVTSVLIHENDQKTVPNLKLKKVDLETSPVNNQLQVKLQNSAMVYANNLDVDAKVYNHQNKQVLAVNNTSRSIAPNSQFDYLIPLNKQHLKSGKYSLDLNIKDAKTGKTWHFEKNFVVSQQKSIQSTDAYKTISTVPVWYYIFGVLLLLIVILLIVLIFKRKKK
ncbi:DUF916 and DUF3324 domain-containing protein [Fructilactobacillus frigidiflavus]|uniref:DUF916 and DUF3324 domain-containing protein n=1 Tax=Fructilactobacillus frigidiflavus TaxID=3242688 RepID=UPI003756F0B5